MELYIFEDYKNIFPELKGRELTDRLILTAMEEYGCHGTVIMRTEKGKPYAIEEGVFFSVSHSGAWFTCLIGEVPLGVDIQHRRSANIEKISQRYFSPEETAIVNKGGEEEFFKLWTRKEAYCKYTGKGLEDILKKTPVLNRNDVDFIDIQLEKDLYCSCCIKR